MKGWRVFHRPRPGKAPWSITVFTRSSPIPRTVVIRDELPAIVASANTQTKVFLTYESANTLTEPQSCGVLGPPAGGARGAGWWVRGIARITRQSTGAPPHWIADGRTGRRNIYAWSRPKAWIEPPRGPFVPLP